MTQVLEIRIDLLIIQPSYKIYYYLYIENTDIIHGLVRHYYVRIKLWRLVEGLNQMDACRGRTQPPVQSMIVSTLPRNLGCRTWRHISEYGTSRNG